MALTARSDPCCMWGYLTLSIQGGIPLYHQWNGILFFTPAICIKILWAATCYKTTKFPNLLSYGETLHMEFRYPSNEISGRVRENWEREVLWSVVKLDDDPIHRFFSDPENIFGCHSFVRAQIALKPSEMESMSSCGSILMPKQNSGSIWAKSWSRLKFVVQKTHGGGRRPILLHSTVQWVVRSTGCDPDTFWPEGPPEASHGTCKAVSRHGNFTQCDFIRRHFLVNLFA